MNLYCNGILKQLNLAAETVISFIRILEPADLEVRPTPGKHSVGELLVHLSVLCVADWKISSGASLEDMETFYAENEPPCALPAIEQALRLNVARLEQETSSLTDEQLSAVTTSYWGASYSRYEWLVETLAHFYHHRGQLHAMLVHSLGKDPSIPLFA
ncbi:DinB family protein [Saccharibacillus sacchari]|uniref:DinB family protein n=1 Tax=Saccharibacillus sacchari TaxID=456493 RepID=A0ACC6PA93_9BACL